MAMDDKIQSKVTIVKLQVPAGQASPSPPVGPALGQHGLNIMDFCKAFNAQTKELEPGVPVPVVVSINKDKSFTFVRKTPPAAVLLRQAAGISKGSPTPNTEKVGTVTLAQLEDIVRIKEVDMTAANMDAAVRTIAGTAMSMGILVEGQEDADEAAKVETSEIDNIQNA